MIFHSNSGTWTSHQLRLLRALEREEGAIMTWPDPWVDRNGVSHRMITFRGLRDRGYIVWKDWERGEKIAYLTEHGETVLAFFRELLKE